MLLVTKSVGDLFKARGIADEMIRFNGYPILEKEEIIYNALGIDLFYLYQSFIQTDYIVS